MSWAYALLAGYIGAIITIVVGTSRKKGWLDKISGTVVFVVATIAWSLLDVYHLVPCESPDYGLTEEQQFEEATLSNPAFQMTKGQESKLT